MSIKILYRGDFFMLNFVLCDDHVITLNKLSKMLESIFIEKNGLVLCMEEKCGISI